MNSGTYGSSFDDANSSLKITLLRSPSYTAHPIPSRKPLPQDRYMPHMDQGERDFSLKIIGGTRQAVLDAAPRAAQVLNEKPTVLSLYPTGGESAEKIDVKLTENPVVTVTAFKKAECGDGYIIRIFNPTERSQTAILHVASAQIPLNFGKYEIKSVRFANGKLTLCSLMEDLI